MKQLAVEFHSGVNKNSIGALLAYLGKLPQEECDLLLLFSSDGGNNQWARSAYSDLVNLPQRIHLTICGCGTVDSAAVTLFCAAKRRTCLPFTRFLLHQASMDLNEKVDIRRAREIANTLESDDHSAAIAISTAMNRPLQEVAAWIQQGTVWTAEEALRHGLVQEITPTTPRLLEGRTVEKIFNISDSPKK